MGRRFLRIVLSWTVLMPVPVLGADLARFFATVHTLRGRFTQIVRDHRGHVVSRGHGQLWLKRPGRFRWDYAAPYREQIVGDGRQVWLYDPGLAQATRYQASAALGRTPALLLAGDGHLSTLFAVETLPSHGGLQWIVLRPRGRGQGFRWIRIGYRGVRIRRIVVGDAMDQTTDIRLSGLHWNMPLPTATFHFRPPPHTAIVTP